MTRRGAGSHAGSDPGDPGTGPGGGQDQRWLLYLSSVVAITGVQLVVPALPALQRDLALSDGELSLVTSAYLFPSVPAAFASGLLADRFGRRRVYAGSLLLFGVAGTLVPLLGHSSFPLLLALRMVQGTGFAGVLPMTITLIGDMFGGATQIRVQGHRSLAMQLGDAGLPPLGGLLAGVSWHLPFLAPALGVALAGMVLWRFPAGPRARAGTAVAGTLRQVPQFMRDPSLVALQLAGFMRFAVKFVALSYLPVLAVNEKGISTLVASLALGLAAAAGGLGAVSAARLTRVTRPTRLLAASVCTLAAGMLGMALTAGTVGLLLSVAGYGVADGLFGVLLNAMVARAVGDESRATFVSLTGTVRNLGKFVAPVMAAGVALAGPLSLSFAVTALLALLTLAAVHPLGRFDPVFTGRGGADGLEPPG